VRQFLATHPDVSQRDSSKVDAIRIGGHRARSLERIDRNGKEYTLDVAETEADLTPQVSDWRSIIRATGLTKFEGRVFIAHWRHLTPVYQLPHVLNCRPSEASRALMRVAEKLVLSGCTAESHIALDSIADSKRLAYRERFYCGARPWSLTRLGQEFARLMAVEKYIHVLSQRDPSEFQKSGVLLRHISRRIFVLTVQVTQEQIDIQVASMSDWKEFRSTQYIEDYAKDLVKSRLIAEREANERSRIESLRDSALIEELQTTESRFHNLRDRADETHRKLKRLYTDREAKAGDGLTKKITTIMLSGIAEVEREFERLTTDLSATTWLLTELRDQQDYRQRVERQRQASALETKLEVEVEDSLSKLGRKLSLIVPSDGMFSSTTDPTERTLLIIAARAVAHLGTYRKTKEMTAA
jgi:hypothetical protein